MWLVLGRRGQKHSLQMLVMRENLRGATRSHALCCKHVSVDQGSYATMSMVGNIGATGLKLITLESDREPVMNALHTQIKKMKFDGDSIPTRSPKGQSAPSGVVEFAAQDVEAQFRTMVLALGNRLREDCYFNAGDDLDDGVCFVMHHSLQVSSSQRTGTVSATRW